MAYNSPLYGAMRPRNPGAGLYPGSGVAIGGQQGRSGSVHNGISSISGGGLGTGGSAMGFGSVARPRLRSQAIVQSINRVGSSTGGSAMTGRPTPIIGGSSLGGHTAAPVDPFARYQDSQYWDSLTGLQDQLSAAQNPLLAKINTLRARYTPDAAHPGRSLLSSNGQGETLYDQLYRQAQDNFTRSLGNASSAANQHGLLHSGYLDTQKSGLGQQFSGTSNDLYNTQGQGAIDALDQQRLAAQQQYDINRAGLARAAIARALQQQGQNTQSAQNIYQSIFPR